MRARPAPLLWSLSALALSVFVACAKEEAPPPAPPPPAPPAVPAAVDDARALVLGLADAVARSEGCDAVVAAVAGMVQAEGSRIARLGATDATAGAETLNEVEQAKVDALVAKARECSGTASGEDVTAGEDLAAAVEPLTMRRMAASPKDSSGCDCEEWCPQGFDTWLEVSEMTLACLGGDNQACCTAVAIASYTACINTYCPEEDCCLGVPVSVPPPPI